MASTSIPPAPGVDTGADAHPLSSLERDLRACGALVSDEEVVLDVPFDRPLLDELQRLGGRFDPRRKRWIVPRAQMLGLEPLLPRLAELDAARSDSATRE